MDILHYLSLLLEPLAGTALIHSRSLLLQNRDIDILCIDPVSVSKYLQKNGFIKISPTHYSKFSQRAQRLVIIDLSDHYQFLRPSIKSLVIQKVLAESIRTQPYGLKVVNNVDSALYTIMKYHSSKRKLKKIHKSSFSAFLSYYYPDANIDTTQSRQSLILKYLQAISISSTSDSSSSLCNYLIPTTFADHNIKKIKRVFARLSQHAKPALYISMHGAISTEVWKQLRSVPNIRLLSIDHPLIYSSSWSAALSIYIRRMMACSIAFLGTLFQTKLCILTSTSEMLPSPNRTQASLHPLSDELDLAIYRLDYKAAGRLRSAPLIFRMKASQWITLNSVLQYLEKLGYLPRV
jgi:hypothetical protein